MKIKEGLRFLALILLLLSFLDRYAVVRFNQYFKMKPEVTALKVPE